MKPTIPIMTFVMEVDDGNGWKPWAVCEACDARELLDDLPDYPVGYDYRIKRLDRVLLNTTINLIREFWG